MRPPGRIASRGAPPPDRRGDRRGSPRTPARPGRSPYGSRSRARPSPPSCPRRLNRLARLDPAAARASATNGRGPASSCISTSSRSRASCASGTAFIATARRVRRRLGVRPCRRRRLQSRGLRRGPAGSNRRDHRGLPRRTIGWFARRGVTVVARPDRQRQRLHQSTFSGRRGPRRVRLIAHAPVSPADQRQSRTIHSDADSRLGLCGVVSQLVASHARAASLAPALQRRAATRRARLSTTVRPLSEGRAVNNLVRSNQSAWQPSYLATRHLSRQPSRRRTRSWRRRRCCRAAPLCDLTERAQRPRPVDHAVRHSVRPRYEPAPTRPDRTLRSPHLVERVGARPSRAMIHPGHHVQLHRRADARATLGSPALCGRS